MSSPRPSEVKTKYFTFANSSAATFKRDENAVSGNELLEPIVKPTAYNITAIYPYVIAFDMQLVNLFGTIGIAKKKIQIF